MKNLDVIARKITTILFAQQSLASAGFIAAATLNSIVGKELSGHSKLGRGAIGGVSFGRCICRLYVGICL